MTNLPANPSRSDIMAALRALPESNHATRAKLVSMYHALPSGPAIKVRHGARPGEVEVFEDGRWIRSPVTSSVGG